MTTVGDRLSSGHDGDGDARPNLIVGSSRVRLAILLVGET